MTKYILSIWALLLAANALAQNTLSATVKDKKNEPIAAVSVAVKGTNIASISDSNGIIILNNIPNGIQTITFIHPGFEASEQNYTFPTDTSIHIVITLNNEDEELQEVVIQSTRTSRTFKNTPTRIETIDAEELDEKTNMRPSNVAMALHESTGIQVQQTSATSGNASIRMQGLDGRYTQLLKDGYPSFGNFASGLSILEIPPLDLKQVEIIKGPASTLYGAGAIAGVVNFISKTPLEQGEYNLIANQSNVGQTNIGGFAAKRNKKIGYSILALYNYQKPYDVDKDGFTELPKSNDFTLHPKVFFYPNEKTTFVLGNSFTKGNRTGGDINVIEGHADSNHAYFETNNTIRNTTTLDLTRRFNDIERLTLKSAFNYFDRNIAIPGYSFKGSNYNIFNDISYLKDLHNQTIIWGGSYIYDNFIEHNAPANGSRNFKTNTAGLYVQHTWDISGQLKLESGLRADFVHYNNPYYSNSELFILPRISALYQFNQHWSSRIGGGLGYKTPTIFTEQTETFQYQHVLPLANVTSEKSHGATADMNYKTPIGKDFNFSANQMFFFNRINNATVLQQDNASNYFFANTNKPVNSLGFETNAKLTFRNAFKFFLGYTYTHAQAKYLTGNQFLPLLPKSKLNLALIYEKERNFKIGLEGYFTDHQYLYNGTQTPAFWEFGLMAEKTFGKVSVFINAENFTDTRQSRYQPVVHPPYNNPTFDEIWTHTEGRTFNGGIKLKL